MTIRVLLLTAAVAALLAPGAPGAPAQPARPSGACGDINGPSYTLFGAQPTRAYRVWTRGAAPCSLAKTWTRRLAGKHASTKVPTTLTGGPAGWRCVAVPTRGVAKAVQASCKKGSASFGWDPTTLGTA